MNILYFIWNFYPDIEGGSERQNRLVASHLVKRGCNCTVYTARTSFKYPRHEILDGIKVIRLGLFSSISKITACFFNKCMLFIPSKMKHKVIFWLNLPFVWISRISFMLELMIVYLSGNIEIDIIHLYEPSWLTGLARMFALKYRAVLYRQEATTPVLKKQGFDVPLRKIFKVDYPEIKHIAMADYIKDALVDKGIEEKRITILPNGIILPKERADVSSSKEVIYVGNFSQGAHWKAFDILFDSWAIVANQIKDVSLTLVGGGDNSLWCQRINDLGLSDRVNFIGRVDDPSPYYKRGALFLLPSRVEGLSNALLEAQSWGLPAVVSDIPGNKSVITDKLNGLVVPVNSTQDFASAIIYLLKNRDTLTQMSVRAIENSKRFDIERIVDTLLHLYAEDISKGAI